MPRLKDGYRTVRESGEKPQRPCELDRQNRTAPQPCYGVKVVTRRKEQARAGERPALFTKTLNWGFMGASR